MGPSMFFFFHAVVHLLQITFLLPVWVSVFKTWFVQALVGCLFILITNLLAGTWNMCQTAIISFSYFLSKLHDCCQFGRSALHSHATKQQETGITAHVVSCFDGLLNPKLCWLSNHHVDKTGWRAKTQFKHYIMLKIFSVQFIVNGLQHAKHWCSPLWMPFSRTVKRLV